MNNTKKGFTLVELLVVIAILAILATVSVVGYTSFIERANDSVAVSELTQIRDYAISMDVVAPTGNYNGTVDTDEAEAAFDNAGVTTDDTKDVYYVANTNADGDVVSYTLVKGSGSATWTLATGAIQ